MGASVNTSPPFGNLLGRAAIADKYSNGTAYGILSYSKYLLNVGCICMENCADIYF